MGNLDLAEREALQDHLKAQIAHLQQKAKQNEQAQRKLEEQAVLAADEAKFKSYAERLAKMAENKDAPKAS